MEKVIGYVHRNSENLNKKERELFIWSFIAGVRSGVQGIVGGDKHLVKIPISGDIPKKLVEFGSREASGNHGILSRNELNNGIEGICLQLSDLTRAPFSPYYTIAQKDEVLAIQKTYPLSGGLRGVASHSDAILINDADIPHGGDITPFLKAFPDEVEAIGSRSGGFRNVNGDNHDRQINNLHEVLMSVFRIMNGEVAIFPTEEGMDSIEIAKFLLDVYSLLPKEFRKNFHPIRIKSDTSIDYPLYSPNGW